MEGLGRAVGREPSGGGTRAEAPSDRSSRTMLCPPQGNGELLFTYGFTAPDNPLDTVEGIIVGCAPTARAELSAERRRLLNEQASRHRQRYR